MKSTANRYQPAKANLTRSLLLGIPSLGILLMTLENIRMAHQSGVMSGSSSSSKFASDYALSEWIHHQQHFDRDDDDFYPRIVCILSPLPMATPLYRRTLSPPPHWPLRRYLRNYNASKLTNLKLHERQQEDTNYESVQNKYYNMLKSKRLNGIPEHEHCALSDWQKTHYPVCNSMHEYIDAFSIKERGKGSQSIVFAFYDPMDDPDEEDPPRIIWKTQMWKGDYVEGFYPEAMKRRQIEARVMERGTASPFLLPLYGTCGISTFVPYKNGYSLSKIVRYRRSGDMALSDTELLNIASQMAQGVADLHALNFVHLDLYDSQWIAENGIFQLNDFNFGKYLLQDMSSSNKNTTCRDTTYPIEEAVYKSPEEIRSTTQTGERIHLDKADVFVLGNVLYKLFTKKRIFKRMNDQAAYKHLLAGQRPPLPKADTVVPKGIVHNQETWTTVLTVLGKCWEHDPEKRATAQAIADILKEALWRQPEFRKLDPSRMTPQDVIDKLRIRVQRIDD